MKLSIFNYQLLMTSRDPRGIALLITVILLGGLILIAFAASSLVMVFGQTSKVLGNSEKAYYAAESALEKGLYDVEKLGLGLSSLSSSGIFINNDGTTVNWNRKAFVTSKIPLGRTDVRPANAGNPTISGSNALLVTLLPGGSFQMDLNIVGATNLSYPSHISVSASSNFSYITLNEVDGQTGPAMTTGQNQRFPSTGTIDPLLGLRFKISNPTGGSVTYTIAPNGSNELPVALVISATGVSGNEERTVEVERKAWLMY